ncbi:MAG: peptidase T [Caldilineaceae bacterium]
MSAAFEQKVEERLLRYVQIDTQSDETSATTPSTLIQLDLLHMVRDELTTIGASDVVLTDYGAVLATIPANAAGQNAPMVAFLAHVDTAPAFHASGVKPLVHRNYSGEPIALPDDPSQVLQPDQLPYLQAKLGDDIITASGTTLLGADDKAGVAIIMTLAEHVIANPDIPHGKLRLCFTPDEEIGRGVHDHLPTDLGADFAYTLDGAEQGEFVYESFSADKAVVKVTGVSTHPGTAKGQMVNALHLAAKILAALPQHTRTPETTEGREGFIHAYKLEGTAAVAELSFILRDFELDGLRSHGELVQAVCNAVQLGELRAKIECTITPQYRNMRYWLENDMRPVNLARQAIEEAEIQPFTKPIRGGTDGSRLTERGVPTPNLFTGMQNIHGPLEWISVQDMAKATQVCLNLVQLWAQEAKS